MVRLEIDRVCIAKNKFTWECSALPHSPNKSDKMHWSLRKKWTDAWDQIIGSLLMTKRKELGKIPYAKVKITVELQTTHPMDKDNRYRAVKPIIDAIRRFGVMIDDKDKYLDLEVNQSKVHSLKERKTIINIEEICPNEN